MATLTLYRGNGFSLGMMACFLWIGTSCGTTCPSSQYSAHNSSVTVKDKHEREAEGIGEVDADLVGQWKGYWSLKGGKLSTEEFLFLSDGRWGWIASKDKTYEACDSSAPILIQRSGRWRMRDAEVVLEETGRTEVVKCNDTDEPEGSHKANKICGCRNPEIRVLDLSKQPIMEKLSVGACPENREAEKLDKGYVCRSFNGRAFWRSVSTDKQKADFFHRTNRGPRAE